ncbi:MAG: HAD family hydrolase [Bacteroidales bacterium]|nr:HAD family hydrolase [Bacteroidales bacterium]
MQALWEQIRVVVFDADDTLWENEPLFREAERKWAEVLHEYGDLASLSAALYAVEVANMEDLGYGAKAFTLSLIETAIQVTGGRLSAAQTQQILKIGRQLLHNPAAPMPGVLDTLRELHDSGRYRMVLLTKGDLLDQEHKVMRSGLEPFFDRVAVVSNKSSREYRRLMKELEVEPEHFLAVGNSFKSDIQPVLELGGWGIHIPFHVLWELEKTEEFDHERLLRVSEIRRILPLLLPKEV